jgi:hypothetical protein
MAGANAVLKSALNRSRPYPKASRSTRSATIRDTSATGPNYGVGVSNHLSLGGTVVPNSKNQGRTWQTFGKS